MLNDKLRKKKKSKHMISFIQHHGVFLSYFDKQNTFAITDYKFAIFWDT